MILISGLDFKEFKKCNFCPKTFVNDSFLDSHIKRRHPKEVNNYILPSNNDFNSSMTEHDNDTAIVEREEIKLLLSEIKRQLLNQNSDHNNSNITNLVTSQQVMELKEFKSCQALSISQSLNLSLSLRDRDRADTIITPYHTTPPKTF